MPFFITVSTSLPVITLDNFIIFSPHCTTIITLFLRLLNFSRLLSTGSLIVTGFFSHFRFEICPMPLRPQGWQIPPSSHMQDLYEC